MPSLFKGAHKFADTLVISRPIVGTLKLRILIKVIITAQYQVKIATDNQLSQQLAAM